MKISNKIFLWFAFIFMIGAIVLVKLNNDFLMFIGIMSHAVLYIILYDTTTAIKEIRGLRK